MLFQHNNTRRSVNWQSRGGGQIAVQSDRKTQKEKLSVRFWMQNSETRTKLVNAAATLRTHRVFNRITFLLGAYQAYTCTHIHTRTLTHTLHISLRRVHYSNERVQTLKRVRVHKTLALCTIVRLVFWGKTISTGRSREGEGAKGYKEYKVEHRKNKRIKRECMQDEEKALLSWIQTARHSY